MCNSENDVCISKRRYVELLRSEAELTLLQNGGIDSLDWYSESLYGDKTDNLDTRYEEIKKKVYGNV